MLRWCLVVVLVLGAAVPAGAGSMDPVEVATLGAGEVTQVAISGHYAFCASVGGMSVLDVSDPSAPTLAAAIDLPDTAYGIAISGNYAYLTAYETGLVVVDISDPLHPAVVAQATVDLIYATDIVLVDYYAYLTGPWNGIRVVDIADPLHPAQAFSLEYAETGSQTVGQPVVSGHYLLASTYPDQIRVIDITDPAAPVLAASFTLDNTGAIAVSGNYAYVLAWGGLTILDLSGLPAMTSAGTVAVPDLPTTSVTVAGDRLYAATTRWADAPAPDTLHVFSLADPANPAELAPFYTPKHISDVVRVGEMLYLGANSEGLMVLDATANPPTLLGAYGEPGGIYSLTLEGARLYAVDYYNIYAYDVTEPRAPELLGRAPHADAVWRVVTDGDLVYSLPQETGGGLWIDDFSDPAHPAVVFAGYTTSAYDLQDLAVNGHYLYLWDASLGGLRIVDVSTPSAATEVGTVAGIVGVLAASGPYLYVAAPNGSTIYVLDISNAAMPVLINTVSLSPTEASSSRRLTVEGGRMYLLDNGFGEGIFDLSDPTTPVRIGGYVDPAYDLADFTATGSFGYAVASGKLRVLDLAAPATPVELGQYSLWGWGNGGVAVLADTLYLADMGRGLVVLTNPIVFTDVATNFWAYDAIHALNGAGFAQGFRDNTYRPKDTVTRGQMAAFIARAMCGGEENIPTGPATPGFSDVGPANSFYDHIEYLFAHGVVTGYGDGTYQPTWTVNRGQMAAFLARAQCGGETNVPVYTGTPSFPDVAADFRFYNHIEWIHAHGITTGKTDGLYHPEENCPRDQMAVFIGRAFLGLP